MKKHSHLESFAQPQQLSRFERRPLFPFDNRFCLLTKGQPDRISPQVTEKPHAHNATETGQKIDDEGCNDGS
jgi:hypothetical protein